MLQQHGYAICYVLIYIKEFKHNEAALKMVTKKIIKILKVLTTNDEDKGLKRLAITGSVNTEWSCLVLAPALQKEESH